jgi:hypothetical protein
MLAVLGATLTVGQLSTHHVVRARAGVALASGGRGYLANCHVNFRTHVICQAGMNGCSKGYIHSISYTIHPLVSGDAVLYRHGQVQGWGTSGSAMMVMKVCLQKGPIENAIFMLQEFPTWSLVLCWLRSIPTAQQQ